MAGFEAGTPLSCVRRRASSRTKRGRDAAGHRESAESRARNRCRRSPRRIVETYEECGAIHHLGHSPLPSYREVVDILADLREILYPGYGRRQNLHLGNVAYHVGDLIDSLTIA